MREILFCGKRKDNREWVCGDLVHSWENMNAKPDIQIHNNMGYFDVIPETVGECTSVPDKNGVLIFEGDIIKTHYANTKKNDFIERVVFRNGRFCSMYEFPDGGKMWANLPDSIPHLPWDKTPYMEWCEVIGNIHDNSALLKGE